jgi:hypothetical protein
MTTGAVYVDQMDNERVSHAEVVRALALRDAPLRPAHYMRAAYFRVPEGMPNEERRMVNCIATLPGVLQHIYGPSAVNTRGSIVDISQGLAMFFERAAKQLAALFCNRIVHGGLSASNISLDGRLLDFGMTTSVSDFGPIITSGPAIHMMEQPTKFLRMLEPLFYYVEKFGAGIRQIPRQQLFDHFYSVYEMNRKRGMLRLTGIPVALLDPIDATFLDRLVCAFDSISLFGQREPFKLLSACPRYVAQMPTRFSTPNIKDVLSMASMSAGNRDQTLNRYTNNRDRVLIENFLNAYDSVLGLALASHSQTQREALFAKISENMVCLSSPLLELQYSELNKGINDAICTGRSLSEYVEAVSNTAISRLGA